MRSQEIGREWPNGIRLAYRQQFRCGHFVPVWSNHPKPILFEPDPHVDPDLKRRVLDAGCIKCEEPKEPLDWPRNRGGFLASLIDEV